MKLHKRFASLYFYFAHLKKEIQTPLFSLTSGEYGIFHKEEDLSKLIAPLDSGMIPTPNYHT